MEPSRSPQLRAAEPPFVAAGAAGQLTQARTHRDRLKAWLVERACPLWWRAGVDRRAGGFYEALDQSGQPLHSPRRARVQPRQAYAFALAGSLGWDGPWAAASALGLAYAESCYLRPDGLYRTLVSDGGWPLDDAALLYDQAFMLLGQAAAFRVLDRPKTAESSAVDLCGRLNAEMKTPWGGFRSAAGRDGPLLSNPHMHLLEAALAWLELTGAPIWRALAREIAALALNAFIDPETGGLRETFAGDWSPAPGVEGRIVEPGHQFEWAWLLMRWARLAGWPEAQSAAERLIGIGDGPGGDTRRGVTINALLDDLTVHDSSARLWPQTEKIKAGAALAEATGDPRGWEIANSGAEALLRFLDTPLAGLWRDRMRPDGSFVDEPAPASSFYHIVCAIAELDRVLG